MLLAVFFVLVVSLVTRLAGGLLFAGEARLQLLGFGQQVGDQVALLLQMLTRSGRLHRLGRQIAPVAGEGGQHLYCLGHILLAAAIVRLPATGFRLLAAQIEFCQRFAQGENLRHQGAEAREIEIVKFIQLLHAGIAAIDQIAQAFLERLQLQLAGGKLRIAPWGEGPLVLQPAGDGRQRGGVVFMLKRHDDRQQLIVKRFAF
ncbi:hypothetical protein D3C75_813190 [compost metagenome]